MNAFESVDQSRLGDIVASPFGDAGYQEISDNITITSFDLLFDFILPSNSFVAIGLNMVTKAKFNVAYTVHIPYSIETPAPGAYKQNHFMLKQTTPPDFYQGANGYSAMGVNNFSTLLSAVNLNLRGQANDVGLNRTLFTLLKDFGYRNVNTVDEIVPFKLKFVINLPSGLTYLMTKNFDTRYNATFNVRGTAVSA